MQLSRLRVLLFTFDEGSLARLKQRLIHQGALVSSVDTAKKVPRFIKSVPMHLLIVDSGTAEDTAALIHSVRALGIRNGGDLPAILLTDEEPEKFAASGGNDFHVIMKKPVAPDALMQTVQTLTEKHPAARFRGGVLATRATTSPVKARAGSAA